MLKISKKKSLLLGAIALFAIINFVIVLRVAAPKGESVFEEPKKEEIKEVVVEAPLPESHIIPMPFTPQAPFANWAVHEESCEEAAILMYHHYLSGVGAGKIEQVQADKDLRALRAWQIANWGPEKDLNLSLVGELAKGYWGYGYNVTKDVTAETIKKELASGRPVLVPVMTHSLQNPHYGRDDTYHILVIKGYDATGVITNDAGIREGMDYRYPWAVLWQAIDAQSKKMNQGRDILVITK